MTLYLIGLGLFDHKDVTIRGLEIIKNCDVVYLEHYTSILNCSLQELKGFYGRDVIFASRDLVEKSAEEKLIKPAKEKDVALLVVGDVFGATTHTDLLLRAKKEGVTVVPVYNASVLNAIGVVGLELYKYGKTTSIVYPDNNWLPHTPYDVIKQNKQAGLHTLCLLDIKVAESSPEDIKRGIDRPQQPRYMTVKEGLEVLGRIERDRGENVISDDTLVVGIARLGHPDMKILSGTFSELKQIDFKGPLHSIVIPGKLHHIEKSSLDSYK
ncbi:MAG: diphthine synthase [Nanobdellota archaeon]